MDIIDDKGRLFGVVNVIDALVVLLAVAVVAAGAALVMGGQNSGSDTSDDPESTRYATISYTVPMESEAATLQDTDTLETIRGSENFSVSDIYRSFTPGGSVHVVAKVEYEDDFTAGGNRLYGGQTTELTTGSYRVETEVLTVNQSEAAIATQRVPVVLTANVSASVAQAIEEGQEATIGDQTVATVESVRRGPANDDRQQVWVGVELNAWERATGPAFDGQSLRVDNRVTIITDTVVIRGRLHEVGTTTLPEESDS